MKKAIALAVFGIMALSPMMAMACSECPYIEIQQTNNHNQEAILTVNTGVSAPVDPDISGLSAGNVAVLAEWHPFCDNCVTMPSGKIVQMNQGDQRTVVTINGPGIHNMSIRSTAIGNMAQGFAAPKP